MLPSGKAEDVIGVSPQGQGHETAFSQIVADQLGIGFDDIEILHGDTQSSPRGLDTYGSRSLVVGGIAVHKAAGKVVDRARIFAAHLLEANADDLEFGNGSFTVKGTESSTGIADVAFAVFHAHDLPAGVDRSLDADATFDPDTFSFPHGTHLAAIEIDTETGHVTLRKYVCVDDVGNVVNPLIVEGQVHGGLADGVGMALMQLMAFDEDGNHLGASFMDYLLPTSMECPSWELGETVTPSPHHVYIVEKI